MAKKVEIKKTVFNRKEFNGVVDSKFRFFTEPEPVTDPDTVQELFRLYDKLYALVPIEGEEQTHQYLVERSSELYKIDVQLESIQPLLDEIASLRTQNLEGNRRILELEMQLANGGEINFSDGEQMALLRTQLDTANSAIASLEVANTLANQATTQAQDAATAAAEAATAASQTSSSATNTSQSNKFTEEIIELFNKPNTEYYHAKRLLSEKKYYSRAFRRINNSWNYSSYNFLAGVSQYSWLVEDNGDNNRRGRYRFKLLFDNLDDARRLTMAYVVKNLETAGYQASEIINAVEEINSFKGNVRMRLIEYRDSDKEPKAGYNIVT